jgi:hypothetical protein
MKEFLLVKIRLSVYFWVFYILFLALSLTLPRIKFDSGALTLFSVNSFLYGFYIAPILGAQKGRIEELHKIVRSEANALFSIMLRFKNLPDKLRSELQDMVKRYVDVKLRSKKADGAEKEYEALISYCLNYKGEYQATIDKTLDALVANQQNRTNFAMQINNKVYANEWQIMAILFSITLGFILVVDISNTPLLHIVRALLCTGLSMLILILVKLGTLTHKKAKQMWIPLKKLRDTRFYRID